jgi:hypothetical protein
MAWNVNRWRLKMSLKMAQGRPRLSAGSRLFRKFWIHVFVPLLVLVVFAPVQTTAQVLLGDQVIEGSLDNSSAGMAEAFQATASSTGTLASLTIYLDSSSRSRQIFVGLYTNAAGHPGVLLVLGNSSTPRAGVWNTVSISPVGVTAGTRYWIAVLGTSGTLQFRDSSGGCSSESSAQSNLAGLPARWSSGPIWSTCRLSAYGSAAASSQPALALTTSTLTFSSTQGGPNPSPATVNVTNTGAATLNFTASSDAAWLSVSPVNGTAPQALQMSAVVAGLSANTYLGHVNVVATGAQGSPAVVTVTLNLSAPVPLPAPVLNSLFPAVATAGGSGFTLSVTGANFVLGDVVAWNGVALTTNYVSSSQLNAAVPASFIASVGTASVVVQPPSGANSNALSFAINADPPPVVNSLLPSSATMGGLGFTLTANGSNFILGDTVLWNGSSLSTTFVNATQLTATVPASMIASVGTFNIAVQPPSGTTSNVLSFVVTSVSPAVLIGDQTVEAVPDSNGPGGAEAFQSKALGAGTVNSLVVYLDGASGASQLSAGIYADSGGQPGTLLSQGSSMILKSAAWNTIPISAINVSAGTIYWIAILGTGGTLRFRDGSGCTSVSSAQTNLTTLPSNWTSGSTWPSCPLSAYGVSAGSGVPPSTYTISGTIGSAANGSGSTVILSGAANASTSADTSGNYSFTGLLNGNYTVTPSKPGFSFTPAAQNVAVNGASLTGVARQVTQPFPTPQAITALADCPMVLTQ